MGQTPSAVHPSGGKLLIFDLTGAAVQAAFGFAVYKP